MALRPAFPPLATVAATLLALAALLIAPVDVAKPTAPDNPDSDGDGYQHGDDAYPLHPHRH
jgi:hypothetical protein